MADPYVEIRLEETARYEGAATTTPYRVSTDKLFLPVLAARLTPGTQYLDRSDELWGVNGVPPTLVNGYEAAGTASLRGYLNPMTWLLECCGFEGTPTAGTATPEVQTLTLTQATATGGTWTITHAAQTTAALPLGARAEDVQRYMERLSTVGKGNVKVTGGPLLTGAFTITFCGSMNGADQPQTTATSSLTGPDAPYTITGATTTPGAAGAGPVTDPDGNKVGTGATKWVFDKRSGFQAQSMDMRLVTPNETVYQHGQGYALTTLGMDAQGAISADFVGLVYERELIDPAETPNYGSMSIPPILLGDITLTWGLDAISSARSTDFSLSISSPLSRMRDLSVSSKFPARLEFTAERTRITGTVVRDTITPADLDALLDARQFSVTCRWRQESLIGSSGTYFAMWVEMPGVQLTGGDVDEVRNAVRFGSNLNWQANIDPNTSKDATITLVNGVSAIRTLP